MDGQTGKLRGKAVKTARRRDATLEMVENDIGMLDEAVETAWP